MRSSKRASTPAGRLLAIFEIFSEWFARDDFEGCAFVTSLLEFEDRADPVRQACVEHLATIRDFVRSLASDAGIEDPERFAGSVAHPHEGLDRRRPRR